MANKNNLIIGMMLIAALFSISFAFAYTPEGPDEVVNGTSTTKQSVDSVMVNMSGGTITPINLSATIQNPRWKAFVGQVTGSYTLDDSSGSTIYDWALSTITGRVYATRISSAIAWENINCSTSAQLTSENTAMSHTSPNDNITATFSGSTYSPFYVGPVLIPNTCPSLQTYTNNVSNTNFQEIALNAGSGNMVFATIINEDATGYNGQAYDFQMIVPEVGSAGYTGATPYYLYVEIGN